MNRGLLRKAWRETWVVTLLCGLGLMLIEGVEANVLLSMKSQISRLMAQVGPMEKLLRSFVGASQFAQFGPDTLPSIAWAHPLALVLLWSHAAWFCTRTPAGEVDRGTIDVLLGLSVSRRQLLFTETLVWLVSGAALLAMWVLGNRIGNALADGEPLEFRLIAALAGNLYGLYLVVGGMAWLMSALSDRRGRAVGVVLGFMLLSFLLSYLAPFWSVVERLSFLSILHYYVPLEILQHGTWPVRDTLVLASVGAGLWLAGGAIFARRDLATL